MINRRAATGSLGAPGHSRDCWAGIRGYWYRGFSTAADPANLLHSAERADSLHLISHAGALALLGAVVSLSGGGFSAGLYRVVDREGELAARTAAPGRRGCSGVRPGARRCFILYKHGRPGDLPAGEARDGAENETHQREHRGDDRQERERDCGQDFVPVERGQGDVPLSPTWMPREETVKAESTNSSVLGAAILVEGSECLREARLAAGSSLDGARGLRLTSGARLTECLDALTW